MSHHDECMAELTLDVRPGDIVLYVIESPTGDGMFNALLNQPDKIYAVATTRDQLSAFTNLVTMVAEDTFINLWNKYSVRPGRTKSFLRFMYVKPTMALQKHAWYRYEYITKMLIWCATLPWFAKRLFQVCDRQLGLIAADGRTLYEYVWTVLNGVVQHTNLNENVYYSFILNGAHSELVCPGVLKEAYFEVFKSRVKTIHPRQGLLDTLKTLCEDINRVMLLDHLDTLSESEVIEVVHWLRRKMTPDGIGLLRSVSSRPWYIDVFTRTGFVATMNASHQTDTIVDFTNVYGSFWTFKPIKGSKLE